MKPTAVFCDFDGTITEKDMVIGICERFCPPRWKEIVQDILSRQVTVKDGVAEMFAMIPSHKRHEIVAFARETMRPRVGFQAFLEFCAVRHWLLTVCSGGVDFFIDPLVEPYRKWIHKIYSITADFSGATITLRPTMACETEGTCKVKAMEQFPGYFRILIGDSITDVHGARHADLVFARAGLKKYLDEEHIPYEPFETFLDILKVLQDPVKAAWSVR